MIPFLSSLLTSRVGVYLLTGVTVVSFVFGLYFVYSIHINDIKKSARQEALLEYNSKQIEETMKSQNEFIKKLKEINDIQNDILKKLEVQKELIIKQHSEIESYLNSEDAKKDDRESSPVLKNTIKKLKEIKK